MGRIAFARAVCIDWFSAYRKIVLSCVSVGLVLLVALSQLTRQTSGSKGSDYLEIEAAYSAWISNAGSDRSLLKKVETPLRRRPELETKFGALIAQRLLSLNDQARAAPYVLSSLKRTEKLLPAYYHRFSENSLRISSGRLKEALAAARELKLDMEKDEAFWKSRDKMIRSGDFLYAYNLVRLAFLEKEAGSKQAELAVWDEFLANAGRSDQPSQNKLVDREAYLMVAQAFQEGQVSLFDFIEQRKSH